MRGVLLAGRTGLPGWPVYAARPHLLGLPDQPDGPRVNQEQDAVVATP
jgi:hypothetical protein